MCCGPWLCPALWTCACFGVGVMKVGWGRPSGGLVSAVWYARDVRCDWCHRCAHASTVAALLFSLWWPMVGVSSVLSGSAVRMASMASCFALLKPTKGAVFGSQLSLNSVSGWFWMILSIFSKQLTDVPC